MQHDMFYEDEKLSMFYISTEYLKLKELSHIQSKEKRERKPVKLEEKPSQKSCPGRHFQQYNYSEGITASLA